MALFNGVRLTYDMVRDFLAEGGNPNEVSRGVHLLDYAIRIGNLQMARLLLDRGADPYLESFAGINALHLATMEGDSGILRELLRRGYDPNITNNNGATPLFFAHGSFMVDILLEYNADPNVRENRQQETPLYNAINRIDKSAVESLLNGGADILIINTKNESPLQLAESMLSHGLPNKEHKNLKIIIELLETEYNKKMTVTKKARR